MAYIYGFGATKGGKGGAVTPPSPTLSNEEIRRLALLATEPPSAPVSTKGSKAAYAVAVAAKRAVAAASQETPESCAKKNLYLSFESPACVPIAPMNIYCEKQLKGSYYDPASDSCKKSAKTTTTTTTDSKTTTTGGNAAGSSNTAMVAGAAALAALLLLR